MYAFRVPSCQQIKRSFINLNVKGTLTDVSDVFNEPPSLGTPYPSKGLIDVVINLDENLN